MATTFKLEHEFPTISLDQFVAHLNDPKLNRMLEEGLDFSERKLISTKESPTEIKWVFRVKKSSQLPKAIQKIVKDETFSWEESSRFVRKENCIYWEIVPDSKIFKFHGEGVFRFKPVGKGVKRIMEGEVSVEIPLVGKMVENFIVNELVKSYEIEPTIQKKFFSEL